MEVPKRRCDAFLLIDASYDKSEEMLATMNQTVVECVSFFKHLSETNADVECFISCLLMSGNCGWVNNEPISVDKFKWRDIKASGYYDFSTACEKLDQVLNIDRLIKGSGGLSPAIVVITGNNPTSEYLCSLHRLKKNNFFDYAIKCVLPISYGVDKKIYSEFTGHVEFVLNAFSSNTLKDTIYFKEISAIVTSSGRVLVKEYLEHSDWGDRDYDNEEISSENLITEEELKQIIDVTSKEDLSKDIDKLYVNPNIKDDDSWGSW